MKGKFCLSNVISFYDKVTCKLYWILVKPLMLSLILDQLSSSEIKRFILRWVVNCLNGRAQRVVTKEATSDQQTITSSVPHGSVLGPVLFISVIWIQKWNASLASLLTILN